MPNVFIRIEISQKWEYVNFGISSRVNQNREIITKIHWYMYNGPNQVQIYLWSKLTHVTKFKQTYANLPR